MASLLSRTGGRGHICAKKASQRSAETSGHRSHGRRGEQGLLMSRSSSIYIDAEDVEMERCGEASRDNRDNTTRNSDKPIIR